MPRVRLSFDPAPLAGKIPERSPPPPRASRCGPSSLARTQPTGVTMMVSPSFLNAAFRTGTAEALTLGSVDLKRSTKVSPIFNYPYAETRRALQVIFKRRQRSPILRPWPLRSGRAAVKQQCSLASHHLSHSISRGRTTGLKIASANLASNVQASESTTHRSRCGVLSREMDGSDGAIGRFAPQAGATG